MSRRTIFASTALVILLFTSVAHAEHPVQERGFRAEGVYQLTNLDSVSLFNGNLNITLPLGQRYPVSSTLSYQVMLRYAGNVWKFGERCNPLTGGDCRTIAIAVTDNGGLGWELSFGELSHSNQPSTATTTGYHYTSPDGGEHYFFKTLHDGDAEDAGDADGTSVTYTRDSTYLRMKVFSPTVRIVEFPSGEKHRFEDAAATGTWKLTHIYNAFSAIGASSVPTSNYVAFTYPASPTYSGITDTVITDSLGRTQIIRFKPKVFSPTAKPRVESVQLTTWNDGTGTYTFEYLKNASGGEDITLPKPVRAQESGNTTITTAFLSKLILPNGEKYQFNYLIPTSGSDDSGTLQEMILPTLGKVEYDYASMNFAADAPYEQAIGISARRLYDWSKSQNKYTLVQYTKYDGSSMGQNTVSTMVGWTDDLGTNAQVDYKTIHYFVSTDASWPSNIGLPFTTAPRSGAVPNPDSAGRYLSTEVLDCNPATGACTTERATYVKFERDDVDVCSIYGDPCNYDQNKRIKSTATLFVSDFGKYASVDNSDFDGLGHYRVITTGGNFGLGDTRTLRTDYNLNTLNYNPSTWSGASVGTYQLDASGNRMAGYTMLAATDSWVLDTYTGQQVSENGVTAYVKTCFDPTKNMLVRKRTYKGSVAGINDLLAVYTADASGNVTREELFGGDTQSLSTSSLCTMSLPLHTANTFRIDYTFQYGVLKTSQHKDTAGGTSGGLDFYTVDRDIDFNTGFNTRSRSASGASTSGYYTDYYYDQLGRVEWVTPQPGHGAWIQYDYRHATNTPSGRAQVAIYRRPNGSTTAHLARSSIEYDGLGRLYRESELTADNWWNVKDTRYDHAGRIHKLSSTESYVNDTTPATNWTTYTYDAFGRPLTVTAPDGKVSTLAYTGMRVVTKTIPYAATHSAGTVSESTANTTEEYDRQGRLWKISEAANSTSLTTTEYSYEIGNRLSKVCSAPSAVVCTQTRLFNYDRRGLLTSEQHPEEGANGNGIVSYTYDAKGHVITRTEGPSTAPYSLTYVYDRAGRITQVKETNRSGRVVKQYAYGSGNIANGDGTTNFRNGRLETSTRYNYDRYNMAGEVTVAETLNYGGAGGRISRKTTDVRLAGTQLAAFDQRFTWNELGEQASVTYPDCTAPAGCAGSDASYARTVTNGYTNGFLTSVPGYASSISYHPNGLVNTVVHGNNVKSIQGIAGDQMARPSSITVQDGITLANLWQSGAYVYDGSGNPKKIGSNYYLFDKLGRLIEGTAEYASGSSHKLQRYAYDKFGNMTSMTTVINGATTTTRTIGVYPGTNHLCSGTDCPSSNIGNVAYDDGGNQSSYGVEGLAWDSQDMMAVFFGTAAAYNYFYNADDERVWTQNFAANTNRWTLRGLDRKVLREYSTTGAPTAQTWSFAKDYIYRDSQLLAGVTPSGTVHYHLDHLGSTRVVTNASRAVVAQYNYFPFGEEATSIVSASPELLKFTGHERDYNGYTSTENKGYFDYMHARYGNPMFGRFLSPDPVFGNAQLPQSWNRYAYALNNPMRFVDPDGRQYSETITVTAPDPWKQFWGDFFWFSSGFANGFGSNMLLGTGRTQCYNDACRAGQKFGDLAALGVGAYEIAMGLQGQVGGFVLDLTGAGIAVGVPVHVVSAGVAAHGVTVVAISSNHLMSGKNQSSGGGGESMRALSKGEIKAIEAKGHNVHDWKKGEGGAAKYDLYKDRNGEIYVMRKGGKGEPEWTGYNIKDFM